MIARRPLMLFCAAVLCAVGAGAASAQSTAPASTNTPVTWLIFVDDLHLEFRNTGRLRDAIRTIAAELIHDGDRFAIASSGPSSLAVGITTDRQQLADAIKRATGNALRFDDVMTPGGAAEARHRVSTALTAMQSMLDNLSPEAAPPVALLFISNGYSYELLPDRGTTPPLGFGRDVSNAELRAQLSQLTGSAARDSVRIFAIAPSFATVDLAATTAHPDWPAHHDEMRRSLESISEASGGFAIVDGDFVTQLRRVASSIR
jgi:hypothetical protein